MNDEREGQEPARIPDAAASGIRKIKAECGKNRGAGLPQSPDDSCDWWKAVKHWLLNAAMLISGIATGSLALPPMAEMEGMAGGGGMAGERNGAAERQAITTTTTAAAQEISFPARPIETAAAHAPPLPHEVRDIRVIDGDTIEGTIYLGLDVSICCVIRASDFDAWESRKIRRTVDVTDEEVVKGKAAKAAAEELLLGADTRAVLADVGTKRDAYGRVLAVLWVEKVDGEVVSFAARMAEGGHGRE